MRVSNLFTKTSKTAPGDEVAKNAQLLIRAGFIHKEMAGVYAYLPLGKRVLEKIVQIIREEMDAIGGNEISLTALQQKDAWEASGRWSDDVMDVWLRTSCATTYRHTKIFHCLHIRSRQSFATKCVQRAASCARASFG